MTEVERLQALVDLQAEYIEFLTTANEGPISNAWAHGWRCPQADIDKGADYRRRIADLQTTNQATKEK